MQKVAAVVLIIFLFSCKAKQKVVAPTPAINTVTNQTAANIIDNHYAINRNFKTAYLNAAIDYTDPKQSYNLTADIRIKKDETILISIKFFGITAAKALITPDQVQYYEKANGKYFVGNYDTLSNWLGTDLDFFKIQNLLIGQAVDNLSKATYNLSTDQNELRLNPISNDNFLKSFVFYPSDFNIKTQEIKQINPERKFLVNYSDYKSFSETILPLELLIFAIQNDKTTSIALNYKNATFNQELSFPYTVPSGYQQIIIK